MLPLLCVAGVRLGGFRLRQPAGAKDTAAAPHPCACSVNRTCVSLLRSRALASRTTPPPASRPPSPQPSLRTPPSWS